MQKDVVIQAGAGATAQGGACMYEMIVTRDSGEVLARFDLAKLAGPGDRITIGRGTGCAIKLKHPAISRQHCEIEVFDEDEWILRDLGSSMGTMMDDESVKEIELSHGSQVKIGPAILKFQSVSARIGAELMAELGDDEEGDA